MARTKRFHVLVATDGSAAARAALLTAIQFPWPEGAGASAVVARQAPAAYRRSILLAALDRSSETVATGASRALSGRWPAAEARVVDAVPASGILAEARRTRADVVVMGWRGHGTFQRLLSGSVSRAVVRAAPCAVMVVRRRRSEIRHVVVGFDGSANAHRAIRIVASLVPPEGARVTLFRALGPMPVPAHGLLSAHTMATVEDEVARSNRARKSAAAKELSRAAKVLSTAGWQVQEVLSEGAPLRECLATIARCRADAVIVGARGATGLRRLLLGSVAEGLLDRSPVPVVIVR